MLDLNLLRVFDALWQDHKVVAAAERLGLSAPAVSNALARLRRATGDELFTRTPEGMLPTPHAQALATQWLPALAAVQAGLARPRRFEPATQRQRWRIAMTDIGETVFLPRLLADLAQAAPAAEIETVRGGSPDTRIALQRGELDLAVGWLPDLVAGFHRRRLFEQRYGLLMASGHTLARGRLTAARVSAAAHVQVRAEGTGHERIDALLKRVAIQRRAALVLPHFASLPWVLLNSPRVAVVPERLALQVAQPLGLLWRMLPQPLPCFEVSLVWHHRSHADPAQRWLRERWVALFAEG